ncbi:MAG: helicase HerA-like domain-containing protein, partial [Candidatus Zixiibacteriota bacterium]
MKPLTIGRNGFALPLDAVTTTIGVLGIRGSGKTHTASVITEELLGAGLQVIILDPLDCWFGLRTSADGKGPGYAVTVLGGEHADIPLESSSGQIVADFAVEHGASLVLSLRHFSKTGQRQFVAEFCERLYRLKGKSANQRPLHVVIDEADEVAPQRLGKGSERCFGAVDTLVRRGRSSGIGVTMISQRPAAVNKDILTQIELLIAHRIISPQDRKAIESWIEAHPVGDTADKAAKSLASLDKGECWVWSPSWLDVFKRITIRQRKTFDSSATPKIGARVVAPSGRAEVDLKSLQARMAATIAKAEADDPRILRRRIAELEKVVAGGVADHSECKRRIERAETALRNLYRAIEPHTKNADSIAVLACAIRDDIASWCGAGQISDVEPTRSMPPPQTATSYAPLPRRTISANDNGDLSGPQRKILNVLATHGGRLSRRALALMAGYSAGSGGFNNPVSNLRVRGMIEYRSGEIVMTDAGMAHAEPLADLQSLSGRDLVEWWISEGGLSGPEIKILESLLRIGKPVDSERLAQAAGYTPGSGGFNNPLG